MRASLVLLPLSLSLLPHLPKAQPNHHPPLLLHSLHPRDADFETVRTGLSGSFHDLDAGSREKYFHESTFDRHYDGRFAATRLDPGARRAALTALVQTYLVFASSVGAETWLAHGTLLGWWWDRRVLPWDSDVDAMTSQRSLRFLADYHNMTVHTFAFPGSRRWRGMGLEGGVGRQRGNEEKEWKEVLRSYLLEINPHCVSDSRDAENAIDARWIDRENGVFIDITTARRNLTAVAEGDGEALTVKDGHHYRYDDIWPLRETEFEGMPAWVPFAYPELLAEEYGDAALSMSRFMGHRFSEGEQRWVSEGGDGEDGSSVRRLGTGPDPGSKTTSWRWLWGRRG